MVYLLLFLVPQCGSMSLFARIWSLRCRRPGSGEEGGIRNFLDAFLRRLCWRSGGDGSVKSHTVLYSIVYLGPE
jgi:hypothetical protein